MLGKSLSADGTIMHPVLNKLISFVLTLLCLTCLILYHQNADADTVSDKRYQIELIIFKTITPENFQSEQWPSVATLQTRNPAQEITAYDVNKPEGDFQLLPANKMKLLELEKSLDNKQNYKVLTHISWQQSLDGNSDRIPIHISGGDNYLLPGSADQHWELEGYLNIKRNSKNSLVRADFALTEPQDIFKTKFSNYFNNLIMFRLNQSRLVKDGEVNYFDHPLFGMLVVIS